MERNYLQQVTRVIKTLSILSLLTSLATFASDAKQTDGLLPFKAEYTAYKWNDDIGHATMTLEPLAKDQYSLTYVSKVSKFFLSDKRHEHSIFFVDGSTITPSAYYYQRSGTGPDKSLEVQFKHTPTPTINVDDGERKTVLPWQDEFDNQLFRLDLAQRLKLGEKDVRYNFVNTRGELREYHIKVIGDEALSLPYGQLQAIKVKILREESTRETFVWFAPDLDYVLVRLQQFKDGDEQGDIQLSNYQRLSQKTQ